MEQWVRQSGIRIASLGDCSQRSGDKSHETGLRLLQ
eukprot:CAMPEP_0116854254 /NCGR_PEP_ID=MMETSP0418-20121206/18472_1 /TAXON_ID=1158023 /ORGANISM="Astrosyne radiata, Strain 13vi08-1A" /LENGTH=35 /DNA_ID= /DNA_START= /DNA_END= /DNA_ORIENTATION=